MNHRKFLSSLSLKTLFPALGWVLPQAKRNHANPEPLASAPVKQTGESATASRQAKIRLLACGGAAIAIAGQIDKARYGIDQIIAVDTSSKAIRSARYADQCILLKPFSYT